MSTYWLVPDATAITIVARRSALPDPSCPGDGEYAEFVYAGVVGCSALLIYRHFLRLLRSTPGPIRVEIDDLAASFGLRRDIAIRSLGRLVHFGFARFAAPDLEIRPVVPLASSHLCKRLSPSVRRFHFEAASLITKAG